MAKSKDEENASVRSEAARREVESAADYVAGDARTSPGHDATQRERAEAARGAESRLREWAQEHGKLRGSLPKEDQRGSEHIVEFNRPKGRVTKATRPESHMGFGIAYGSFARGANAGEYLDRLA